MFLFRQNTSNTCAENSFVQPSPSVMRNFIAPTADNCTGHLEQYNSLNIGPVICNSGWNQREKITNQCINYCLSMKPCMYMTFKRVSVIAYLSIDSFFVVVVLSVGLSLLTKLLITFCSYLSIYLILILSIYLSIYLILILSIYLSISFWFYLSIYLSNQFISIYLSISIWI